MGEEYENYKAQYELYKEANKLLNSSKPETSKIMDILLKTFSYGSLPPEVMDGMMPDELKQFADQMAAFEKDIDSAKPSDTSSNVETDDNAQNSNEQSHNGNSNEDMNPEEAMKFFQQL